MLFEAAFVLDRPVLKPWAIDEPHGALGRPRDDLAYWRHKILLVAAFPRQTDAEIRAKKGLDAAFNQIENSPKSSNLGIFLKQAVGGAGSRKGIGVLLFYMPDRSRLREDVPHPPFWQTILSV